MSESNHADGLKHKQCSSCLLFKDVDDVRMVRMRVAYTVSSYENPKPLCTSCRADFRGRWKHVRA